MTAFNKIWHIFTITCVLTITSGYSSRENGDEEWHGKWFPFGPNEHDENPVVIDDKMHHVPMGVLDASCDDAKSNLMVDWDGSPSDYLCYEPKKLYKPQTNINPLLICEHIPKMYAGIHVCMNESIEYNTDIPTYGPHRPQWARYGEYKYLPKQRWVHNLEHGAVVMLYHPCANILQINKLKQLVKSCLYRHIITPSVFLSPEKPLALLTWGCKLEMSFVYSPIVKSFIETHALNGPEKLSKDGLFTEGLLQTAKVVSDQEDTALCPVAM